MNEGRSKGLLVAALVWCVIVVVLAVAYRFLVHPYVQDRIGQKTGSASQYRQVITVAADSFSGYCILRSERMGDMLKAKGIKLDVQDDGADYHSRIKALRDGRVQMAVFTIDSFLSSGAAIGEYPGSIVLVIDETKGADAIVAYKAAVGSLQDLDRPDARIVATPNSPSEFLARVVLAHFSLPRLPEDWLIEAEGAGDAYKRMRAADKNSKRAYVVWEPYVSMALEDEGVHVLLDSSKMSGLIVDVLVAQRKFLIDHADLVKEVVEAYLRAAFAYSEQESTLADLVRSDARQTGAERLNETQAKKLVAGIRWKNTLENYAHFGLLSQQEGATLRHIEDMIGSIADVLVRTGALPIDPTAGKAHTLFYDKILGELKAADFHPAKQVSLIPGVGLGTDDLGELRGDKELPALSESDWNRLMPVGEMRIRPLAFARGTARINLQSQRDLEELAKQLKSLPQYYLTIVGHARAEGDREQNIKLARERAEAAVSVLHAAGVSPNRTRVVSAPLSQRNGSAQSVSFVVGQMPY